MNTTAEEVFDAALDLSDDERLELVEAFIVSLGAKDRPLLDESWREVIQRRSAELRSAQVTAVPWTEVKRNAREGVGGT